MAIAGLFNEPEGTFQLREIERLYARLYPLIARDFRHVLDCDNAMKAVVAGANAHIHTLVGTAGPLPIVGEALPTNTPLLPISIPPPFTGGLTPPLGSAAASFISVSASVPPYAVRIGDPISPPLLSLPPNVPAIPGGL